MSLYVQLILNTLQIGAVYVLVALGLTLIFGVMKIVNFAHGTFFTAAALAVAAVMPWATSNLGLPVWAAYLVSFAAALATICAIGFITYRFGFQFFVRDLIGSFILSIGIAVFLNGAFLGIFGGSPRTVPALIDGNVSIFGAFMTAQRLLIIVFSAVITVGLYLLIRHTKLGLGLRAAAEDPEAAMLQGIRYRRTALQGFMIGAALAACAGAMMAPVNAVTTVVGDEYLIKAFIIIIIGGLGSVGGAIIGGLLIALIESVGGYYYDPSTATIAMFVLVMVVLVLRPQGFMGYAER